MSNDPAVTNQLKAVDSACRQLQRLTANDAGASKLLFCIRSLLVKALLDRTVKAKLDDAARARIDELGLEIASALGEAPPSELSPMQVLSDVVSRLQRVGPPAADALIRPLLDIEAQHLSGFEAAFLAASAADAEGSAPADESYSATALAAYLATEVFADPDLQVDTIDVVSGGYSKLTLRARVRSEQAPATLILRVDRLASQKFVGTRVADEYPLLIALYDAGVCVPKPYALEGGGTVLGAPALVLGEVAGGTVGDLFNFPAPDRELAAQLTRQLALIHAMPPAVVSRSEPSAQEVVDALRQEIEGFRAGWKSLGRASAIIEAAFHCIDANMHLAAGRCAFVHGDFGLHNVLVDQGRVAAVLDWEFSRLANPAVDLGWFYYTAEHLVGWERFLSDYADAGGTVPPGGQLDFYRLWGALRFAVICHQVDAGFDAGAFTEIDYAVPGNRLLRTQLLRVKAALAPFGAS